MNSHPGVLTSSILICMLFAMCQADHVHPTVPFVINPVSHEEQIDILALGDSYTKGQSVLWPSNFPNQLADSLRLEGREIFGPRVIAQTGWRTDNLSDAIDGTLEIADSTFSIVTLCIGVNNQYQHASFDTYKADFEQLLKTAVALAGGRPERVFVLSIPDWAYTPFGQSASNPTQVSVEIDQYNAANKHLSQQYEVNYLDVTGISREGLNRPDLVADDGLHPSAQQYTEWVRALLPLVRATL